MHKSIYIVSNSGVIPGEITPRIVFYTKYTKALAVVESRETIIKSWHISPNHKPF